jgi:hypothetical protein
MTKCRSSFLRWAAVLAFLIMLHFGGGAVAGGPETVGDAAAAAAAAAADAPSPGPDEVITGVYVNDIHELDFRTHSYTVDFYVWFRWRNKDINPAKTMEFMNRSDPDDHVRDMLAEEPKELPDGSFYSIVRNQGRFATKLRLENYPFDTQELVIVFEDSENGAAAQVYRNDTPAVTLSNSIVLPGFGIDSARMEVTEQRYPTNFGDPTVGTEEAYSRAAVTVAIARPMMALSIKTFLPILLIISCAGLVLFIRPAFIDARVGLGITALLTLVALQLAGGASLPDVDYLTMVDKVYLASYGFIMLVLLRVVRASWRDSGGERAIVRGDRVWFALIVLLYMVVLSGIAADSFGGMMFAKPVVA